MTELNRSEDDRETLLKDINTMLEWTNKWQLEFHPDKCVSMSINNKEDQPRTYKMKETTLKRVKQEKDIGVVVDEQLKFESHIYEKINKANSMIGLIRRSFIYMDEDMFKKLFKAIVRPHLEYANSVWHPTKIKDITAIENVQRRATKYLPTMKNLSYEERLQKLGLPTLQYRRLRGDMIETYKLMTAKYDAAVSNIMPKRQESATSLPTRGHIYKLFQQRAEKPLRQNFLSIRVVSEWNSLPSKIVEAPNLKVFERRLDRHWRQHDLKYNFRGDVNCSPIANKGMNIEECDAEEVGAADDLDI